MFLGKIWKWKRKGKILYWKEDCSKVFEQSPRKTHHLLFFNVKDEQKEVDWKSVEIWRHCAEQEDCWNQRRKARTGKMCRYILVPVCKWFTAEWGKPRYKKITKVQLWNAWIMVSRSFSESIILILAIDLRWKKLKLKSKMTPRFWTWSWTFGDKEPS